MVLIKTTIFTSKCKKNAIYDFKERRKSVWITDTLGTLITCEEKES